MALGGYKYNTFQWLVVIIYQSTSEDAQGRRWVHTTSEPQIHIGHHPWAEMYEFKAETLQRTRHFPSWKA